MRKAVFVFLPVIMLPFFFNSCISVVDEKEAATAYFNLGNTYFELEKYDEAIKAYARAIELDKTFERASYNLARLYLETDRIDEGIEVLMELSEEDDRNSHILNTLAYAYTLKGDGEEALKVFNQVLERSPYDKNALYNIGILLWNKGDREEALNSFLSLYEIDPKDSILIYNMGILEIELENRDSGIRYLELYLEQESNDIEALTALGDAYRAEQYYGDALDAYERALKTEEADPELYFKKAYILLTAIGDGDMGLEALEQAIAQQYKNGEQYQLLADDPDLVNREDVRQLLNDKGLISDTPVTPETPESATEIPVPEN